MRAPNETKVFEELYRSYADDVFRFVLYLSGNWALAQDLSSETFVRAWTAALPVQTATAKAYLFVIARNLYLSHLRRQRPEVALEDASLSGRVGGRPGTVSYEHQSELAETLEDLNKLPEGDRAAFVMAVFEEMSHDEVGRSLGISVNAVKARVFRSRTRLTELREQRTARRTQ